MSSGIQNPEHSAGGGKLASLPGTVLSEIAHEHGTPVWVYDAETIRQQVDRLRAFDVTRYAQKACSNLSILRMMRALGVLVDAVSLGEVERALAAGYGVGGEPAPIVFTADLLDSQTARRLAELEVPVNAGSPQMLEQVGQMRKGYPVWIRVNPGFGHGHSRKTNTGGEHSKHGIWHELVQANLSIVDHLGLDVVGFHMHIGSGVDYTHLQRVCESMVDQVRRSQRDVRAISAGGGLSVPYRGTEAPVNTQHYFSLWDEARREIEGIVGHAVQLEIEPGRFLVAQSGVLVTEVRAHKNVGNNHFTLVDAGFNDLMRPAMYGSHHRVSVFDPQGRPLEGELAPTTVAGPLCESGDVFTQNAAGEVESVRLPRVHVGDLVVFHDTGAYGSSMSSNYNTRCLAPEVMVDGPDVKLIRRRQTIDELLALEAV